MNKRLAGMTAVAITLIATGKERPASACSLPHECRVYSALATSGNATVPSNAPALPIETSNCMYARGDGGAGLGFAILTSTNANVPLTVGGDPSVFLLQPSAPLAPGESYRILVPSDVDAGAPSVIHFTAAAAAPLPSTAPSVTIASKLTSAWAQGGSGCTSEAAAVGVELAFQPSAELQPYIALLRWTTTIDGAPWATSLYGTTSSGGTGNDAWDRGYPQANRVYAFCEASQTTIGQGHHTIAVTAHVAGATTDPPPATLEVDFVCPPASPQSPSPTSSLPSPTSPSPTSPSPTSSSPRGGCSTGSSTLSAGRSLVFGLVLVPAAVCVRRRKR